MCTPACRFTPATTLRTVRLAAAALGLLALTHPAAAMGPLLPAAGIDVVLRKQPAGNPRVIGQSGADGWFDARVRVEPGQYRISASCPPRRACPDLRLAQVSVDGRRVASDARGQFIFPVGSGVGTQVRLRASVTCCDDIIHHDGLVSRSAAPPLDPPVAALRGMPGDEIASRTGLDRLSTTPERISR